MYTFKYTAPDGTKIKVTLPENDPERAGKRGLAYWRANKQYNPAGQESFGSDVLLGAGKEMEGSVRGLKQLFDRQPYTFTPKGDGTFSRTSSENQRLIDESKRFDDKYINDRLGVAVGEALPWMAAGGLTGTVRGAAGMGALEGAVDPIAGQHSLVNKGGSALTSAALSGTGAAAAKVMGSLFAPAAERAGVREHAALMGEILDSNTVRTGEAFAKNVPFFGKSLEGSYKEGIDKFNKRVYSDIAKRAGVSSDNLPGEIGNDAIGALGERVGARFDEVVADYVVGKKGKIEFSTDSMQRLDDRIVSGLTAKEAKPVRESINDVLASITKMPNFNLQTTNMRLKLSGPDYRKLDIALRKKADKLQPDKADIKAAITEMRKALLDELPGELKAELGPLKGAYADYVKLSEAAGQALGERGVITPKQLLSRYKSPAAGRGKSPALVKMLQDAYEALPVYTTSPNMLSTNAAAREVSKLRGLLSILPATVVNTPGIRQLVRKMATRDPEGWGKQFRQYMRKYGVSASPGAATLYDPEGGPPPVAPEKDTSILDMLN